MTNKCATTHVICDACLYARNVGYDRDIDPTQPAQKRSVPAFALNK